VTFGLVVGGVLAVELLGLVLALINNPLEALLACLYLFGYLLGLAAAVLLFRPVFAVAGRLKKRLCPPLLLKD
jgi:hypothetical protein